MPFTHCDGLETKPTSATHSPTSAPTIHTHCHYINDHRIQECLATAATKAMIDRTRVPV